MVIPTRIVRSRPKLRGSAQLCGSSTVARPFGELRGWEFRAPERFHYVLFAGMAGVLQHEGRVIVEPDGAGSRLRWEVDFRFRSLHWFRPFVPMFIRQFEGVLRDGVAELARQLSAA